MPTFPEVRAARNYKEGNLVDEEIVRGRAPRGDRPECGSRADERETPDCALQGHLDRAAPAREMALVADPVIRGECLKSEGSLAGWGEFEFSRDFPSGQ